MPEQFDTSSSCRLERCTLSQCEAMCCYDGVYFMNEEEEAAIRYVVKEFPGHFPSVPEEFVQNGYWQGQFFGRKTLTVPHTYQNPDYPKHFAQTRCVFAEADGTCSLETLARSKSIHPWTFKPSTCWIHPADDTGDGLEAPPLGPDDDPFNCGPGYPGYASFTSCGKNCGPDRGDHWAVALESERHYYQYVKNDENYGNTVEAFRAIIVRLKAPL